MFKIAKRTSIGALLLMFFPLLFIVTRWHWTPENNYCWLKWMYFLTQTVTPPWGTITTLVFISWFLWSLHYQIKSTFRLLLILIIMLFIGQGIKFFIKLYVKEPRPYVIWLEKNKVISKEAFYKMPRKICNSSVNWNFKEKKIPKWLVIYWKSETHFSFPSGHTIFSSNLVLLAAGLLWPRQYKVSTIALMSWANGVMFSRLMLGMHWPLDLLMSVILSWLIVTIGCWFIQN
ncbi:membrane-associated phospholipid phosphatase [secondary endosymbiont of Heteropsylla cubana]|uniref:undecaprenyl-diphosphate phosphatase n=1 Tax=secondary endosymbiont of Heteropsylla cubana TaxID=134287 RepID=J3Z5F2_9ENTR|nr:phosphatidylglycerophosphatase B [secondary endosymbiont of Heteropsylla cubana]AFP85559.1 membrane-associated phospholipid phosphatase [secondary endosymbiont of Heteropsylla cubana]